MCKKEQISHFFNFFNSENYINIFFNFQKNGFYYRKSLTPLENRPIEFLEFLEYFFAQFRNFREG